MGHSTNENFASPQKSRLKRLIKKRENIDVDSFAEGEGEKENISPKDSIYQNSLERGSVREWTSLLEDFQPKARKSLNLDYVIYGAGEAELGWMDAEVGISSMEQYAVSSAITLVNKIYSQINELRLSIGHLKFFIDDGVHQKKVSFTSMTNRSILENELIGFNSRKIKLIINARVQSEPGQLEKILTDAIRELGIQTNCEVTENKMVAFKPGYPKPTYRILN